MVAELRGAHAGCGEGLSLGAEKATGHAAQELPGSLFPEHRQIAGVDRQHDAASLQTDVEDDDGMVWL